MAAALNTLMYLNPNQKQVIIISSLISLSLIILALIISFVLPSSGLSKEPHIEIKPFGTRQLAIYLNPGPHETEDIVTGHLVLNFDSTQFIPIAITTGRFWSATNIITRKVDSAGSMTLTVAKGFDATTQPDQPFALITLEDKTNARTIVDQLTLDQEESYLTALGNVDYLPLALK